MRYRKKPVVIEAVKLMDDRPFPTEDVPDWFDRANDAGTIRYYPFTDHLVIETPEGDMTANPGDYVIRGVKGEIYPCKPDIFEMTYEPVTGEGA